MKLFTEVLVVLAAFVILDVAYEIHTRGLPLFSWQRAAQSVLVVSALLLFRWATTR